MAQASATRATKELEDVNKRFLTILEEKDKRIKALELELELASPEHRPAAASTPTRPAHAGDGPLTRETAVVAAFVHGIITVVDPIAITMGQIRDKIFKRYGWRYKRDYGKVSPLPPTRTVPALC